MSATESRALLEDERWRLLLERMGVPGHPGIYILGAFARHVTFYSQQVRALNLVDALCNTGRVAHGSSIAVVGAGLAGLTAASAAIRRGLHVHLIEKAEDPQHLAGRMPLQIASGERWIDPFVYDWPLPVESHEADGAPSAGLPLVSWKATHAFAVRDQVLGGFQAIVDAARNSGSEPIEFYHRTITEADLERVDDGQWRMTVDGAGRQIAIDAVLLAVGFGLEPEPETSHRYWTNDGLDGNQANKKMYLVTGAGDGGLTDVMRLCIADFRHRDVLAAFRDATGAGARLQDAVRNGGLNLHRAFLEEAGEIDAPETDGALPSRGLRVYLTGSPERVFGAAAGGSVLNRLIVAWLLRKNRFALVDAAYAGRKDTDGGVYVQFTSWGDKKPCATPVVLSFRDGDIEPTSEPLPEHFHDVVVRHGPGNLVPGEHRRRQPVEEHFPAVWNASRDLVQWWRKLPHLHDWTRQPGWASDAFTSPPLLDPPLRGGPLYVVVERETVTKSLVFQAVRDMLEREYERGQAASAIVPVRVDPDRAFDTPAVLGRAVRIMCRADVAVFDITPEHPTAGDDEDVPQQQFSPELMVLLGIRAVARRSLTLVTCRFKRGEPLPWEAPFHVPRLPFLLGDVSVYGWREQVPFMDSLQTAIKQGLARAERLGTLYRDLPAYDEVRRLGPNPEDFREQRPDDVVLFLTSFQAQYRRDRGSWLQSHVDVVATGRRMYIVQSPSPERMQGKLYAAIRRVQLCIVDWTLRSANVFFELGVRLAVSPRSPVSVIHAAEPWAEGGASGLFDLFQPLVYDPEADDESGPRFRERLRDRKKALNKVGDPFAWPVDDARVSPAFVYGQMAAALTPTTEDWNVPVWQELTNVADQIIGRDPDLSPEFRGIFGENPAYRRQAEENARDRLLAAWYFLDCRHGLGQAVRDGTAIIDPARSPWKEWFSIGGVLERELSQDARADCRRIGKDLASTLMEAARQAMRKRS